LDIESSIFDISQNHAPRTAHPASRMNHSSADLLDIYRRMMLIRKVEERLGQLFLEGIIPGTLHQSLGQEAVAVGVCRALREGDIITSTHRPHAHALAKGVSLPSFIGELLGKGSGCCKGRGGSMHVGDMTKGMVPSIAIVGGGMPIATGLALASKLRKEGRVAVAFTGDGGVAEGIFHEAVNMGAIWDLPVLYVIENNRYAASTHYSRNTRLERLSDMSAAYGIPGITIDGNNVLEVFEAARDAVRRARAGQGPTIIEAMTYRITGHNRRDPCNYMPEDERQQAADQEPVQRFEAMLLSDGHAEEAVLSEIQTDLEAEIEAAVETALAEPDPEPEEAHKYVYAGCDVRDATPPPATAPSGRAKCGAEGMKKLSMADALRDGLTEEMRRDGNVFCMGEDISIPGGWGGVFTVTLGLEKEFRDQLIDTPIAEAGYIGLGVGAALAGMRPVLDVQYGDFLFLAMDQIINQAAKLRYMSGGSLSVPLVIRAPVGATGRGAQHAQNMERYFLGVPGLKVVCPATAYDAKGLLKAAIRDDDPVIMFEHKLLYGSKGVGAATGEVDASSEIPDDDYTVPIGKGIVRRPGGDVTIIATLLMMHFALVAAEELARRGIQAEVIDPRSLDPLDWPMIEESVAKTSRVVIVEEGPKTNGWGAEVAAALGERLMDYLTAPVQRVASPDIPVPFAPALENVYRPNVRQISQAVENLLGLA